MLEQRWAGGSAELFVLYGRRRVGKSELLDRFLEGKRGIYFEATSSKEIDHLEDISRLLAELTGDRVLAEQGLTSWPAVLAAVATEAEQNGPIVVILDEFQYVARETRDIGTRLNKFWREQGRKLPLFLVLSGSDVSFFQEDVMGYSGSMYGRRTGSLRLEPFNLRETRLFVPSWEARELVRTYGVYGSMPYYLDAIDESQPLIENIFNTILAPGALLREEPNFLFSQEGRIRDRRPYFTLLRALAAGQTKSNELAQRTTGGDSSNLSAYLETLQEMQLVRKEHPVTVTNPERSKISQYSIADPFLRFWFRFVLPFQGRLRSVASSRRHLDEYIAPRLDEFVSAPSFEEICRDWLATELQAATVGRWWGKVREETPDGPRTIEREVDVVAVDADGQILALGSCKWTNGTQGDAERKKLEAVAGELCTGGEQPIFYFFSREGFGKNLEAAAASEPGRYRLIKLAELYAEPLSS